jgi:hypothetical protein
MPMPYAEQHGNEQCVLQDSLMPTQHACTNLGKVPLAKGKKERGCVFKPKFIEDFGIAVWSKRTRTVPPKTSYVLQSNIILHIIPFFFDKRVIVISLHRSLGTHVSYRVESTVVLGKLM